MTNNLMRIAIDGGAATGKSTVSKLVADKLNIRYINTGQMYRLFAFVAKQNNVIGDEEATFELIKDLKLSYDNNGNIVCEDVDFTLEQLVTADMGPAASITSKLPKVREVATIKQQEIGREDKTLLEGRDIGTIIMPDAPYKFFLTVSPEAAADRRYNEVKDEDGVSREEILKQIIERNERDTNREIAPLVPAEDSMIIDTSDLTPEEVANRIVEVING